MLGQHALKLASPGWQWNRKRLSRLSSTGSTGLSGGRSASGSSVLMCGRELQALRHGIHGTHRGARNETLILHADRGHCVPTVSRIDSGVAEMPKRRSKTLRGKVRAHDPFELIRWLALSQPDPRKALAELVQNSLDADARTIRVTRVRLKGVPSLRIFDDGEGVIPENGSFRCAALPRHPYRSQPQALVIPGATPEADDAGAVRYRSAGLLEHRRSARDPNRGAGRAAASFDPLPRPAGILNRAPARPIAARGTVGPK